MVFKRHTSPLHFEPLSPPPSELLSEFSDSDDGLDNASRVAKRRKIERLGQDYLEGNPLFILSASLKGPLGNGWVNPWRRKKEKTKQALPSVSSKQNGKREFNTVISEVTSKPFKHRTKNPQVRRQGSGFESSRDPEEPIRIQQPNQLRRKPDKRDRERLETDASSRSRRGPSSNIFSTSRSVSAQLKSTTAERPPRSASASQRVSAGSNGSWLKKNEERLRPQAYERQAGSSPTPGYRPRSSGKSQQDEDAQHNKRQRVDHLVDNHTNYSPPRISFTPINRQGQGTSGSLSSKADRELHPGESSSKKSSKSPGGCSRFPKPEKPASAFTGHSSGREKKDIPLIDGKKGYKSPTNTQISGSLQVAPSTASLSEFHYWRLEKPPSSADTISSSNCNVNRHKHSHSQAPRDSNNKTQLESNGWNGNNNSSHTLALDSTPKGTHDFQDQTFNNATASEIIPSAQVVPDHSKFPNPVISLYSTHFSAAHTSTAKHGSQKGGYEEQLSTQAAITVAQKSLQHELETTGKDDIKASQTRKDLKVAVATHLHLLDTCTSNGQTSNHSQDASTQAMLNTTTPFDFSTVKRTKPGSGSRSEGATVNTPDKSKSERKRRPKGNRNQNSDIPNDPSSSSSPRNQTHSRYLFPKSIPGQHHDDRSHTNGPSSIGSQPATTLPPPSLPNHLSNGSDTNIPPPDGSADQDSTILPFNLTASTNTTNATGAPQQQDGQGHVEGWDNFDLSQAIKDAGTFLGSWDFEKVDLDRVKDNNSNSLNSNKNNGGNGNAGNNHSSKMLLPRPSSSSSSPKLQ